MDRPYIVCLMSCSLDGKITGDFWESDVADTEAYEKYEELNRYYKPKAWINGRITADENFTHYAAPDLRDEYDVYGREDYIADAEAENYYIVMDRRGVLGWKQNYIDYADRPRAHVVELLTDQVSDAYLDFLRRSKISYIFAGEKNFDCKKAAEKIKSLLHVDVLKVSGGGFVNWSFAKAGLIDELSIVLMPVADGRTDTATLFERMPEENDNSFVEFKFVSAEPGPKGSLWLRYKKP